MSDAPVFDITSQSVSKSNGSVIRVIKTKRVITDLSKITRDELALFLENALTHPEFSNATPAIWALATISGLLHGRMSTFISDGAHPTIPSLLIREILVNPAVYPIIAARGSTATDERATNLGGVFTRAAYRSKAVDLNGSESSIASEEPVIVVGFAIDPRIAGSVVFGTGLKGDYQVLAGSDPSHSNRQVLPPEYPLNMHDTPSRMKKMQAKLQRRGFGVVMITPKNPGQAPLAILNQTRMAVNYYLSGAAAVTGLARLAAHMATGYHPDVGMSPTEFGNTSITIKSTRSPVADDAIRFMINKMSETTMIAAKSQYAFTYNLNPLGDLYRAGALSMYLYAITEGRNSETLSTFFEREKINHKKLVKLDEINRTAAEDAALARFYMVIIEDKFGSARSNAILDTIRMFGVELGSNMSLQSSSVQINSPGEVLAPLTKSERQIVLAEYKSRRAAWDAMVGNKCPHVKLAHNLRMSTRLSTTKATFTELKEYFEPTQSKGNEMSWIMCRNCKFQIMCPHVRDKITLEIDNTPYSATRTKLAKYKIDVPAIISDSTDMDLQTYYCKICAESIGVIDDEPSNPGKFGDLDAELRTKIWTIAIIAVKNVRFPIPTNEKNFASTVAAVIYPLLLDVEQSMSKSKKQSRHADDGDIDPSIMLWIIMFVYAYFLTVIDASTDVGFTGVKLGSKAGIYAGHMLRHISNTYRRTISRNDDVSASQLKSQFTKAYKLVRGENITRYGDDNPEESLATQIVSVDPIYMYGLSVAKATGDIAIARSNTPALAKAEFELLLNSPLPYIIARARKYANDPTVAPLFVRGTGTPVPVGTTLEFLMKDSKVNLYADLYEPATDENAVAEFYNMVAPSNSETVQFWIGGAKIKYRSHKGAESKNSVNPNNTSLDVAIRGRYFESYRLFALYTKSIINQEAQDAYHKELAKFRRAETGLRMQRELMHVKTYYDFNFKNTQTYVPVDVALTRIYDENGVPHKWGVYYYTGGSDDITVIRGGPKGVKKARADGILTSQMRLVDVACSICDTKQSEIDNLDVERTTQSVAAASDIASLFIFYKSRCPVGLIHEYINSKCKHCSLTTNLSEQAVDGVITKNARDYYAKYSSKFATEKSELRAAPAIRKTPPRYVSRENYTSDVKSWVGDYTLIVNAAKFAGVTPATIEAIGSMSGREYADIVEGKDIPPPPTTPSDFRIYAVDAEIRLFLSDYSSLRNATKFAKIPPATQEVLNAAGVPPHEYARLSKLPAIGADYRRNFTSIVKFRSPKDAHEFAIQSLCEILLETSSAPSGENPAWMAAVRVEFATQEIALILRGQKLLSKPGTFSWSVFDGDGGDIGDVDADLRDLQDDDEEGAENMFSSEHIMYDVPED